MFWEMHIKVTEHVRILYKNWKGETSWRNITPVALEYSSNEFHPESQWLLLAWDNEKNAERRFAMTDIKEWVIEGKD